MNFKVLSVVGAISSSLGSVMSTVKKCSTELQRILTNRAELCLQQS